MIKFNETFSFERDEFCWNLHESYIGKDKNGADKVHKSTTYHPSLKFICNYIIDKGCGDCESLNSIIKYLESASVVSAELCLALADQDIVGDL